MSLVPPPCPDNWEYCGWCGAQPHEACHNPDVNPEDTLRHPKHEVKGPHAIGANLGVSFRDGDSKYVKKNMAKAKDTNPKSASSRAKVSLSLVPSVAILEMAQAFRDGASKYGPYNWRKDPVSASVYLDAAFRHMELYRAGQDSASDSGIKHIVHAMSCFAILLDADLVGSLIDDRDKMEDPSLLENFLEAARIQNEG